VASGVLERHASVAGSSAGTARAPPAGLGPTPPARDASPRCALCAPARAAPSAPPPPSSRGAPGSRSRRSLLAPGARALDRVRHELLASSRLTRCQNRYVDGRHALDLAEERRIAPLRLLGHEEPRLPPRATIAPRSRAVHVGYGHLTRPPREGVAKRWCGLIVSAYRRGHAGGIESGSAAPAPSWAGWAWR